MRPGAGAGLFGPGSVTWRVVREPAVGLGAARALLLQAAHPLVAQGALDHSRFAADPRGRFERTVRWVTTVVFGSRAEAALACARVNRVHGGVRGALPLGAATGRVPAGTRYAATDPALLRWVHAVLVETLVVSHDAFVGGLTERDRDRLVAEWDAVARLIGLDPPPGWRRWGALRAEVATAVVEGPVAPGRGSLAVAETILHPPAAGAARAALVRARTFLVAGLLPPPVRRAYGLRWGPAEAIAHAAACCALRELHARLPSGARTSPAHGLAMARLGTGLRRAQPA